MFLETFCVFTLTGAIALGATEWLPATQRMRRRMRGLQPATSEGDRHALLRRSLAERTVQPVIRLMAAVGERLTPRHQQETVLTRLEQAGLKASSALRHMLAVKSLGLVLGVAVGMLLPAARPGLSWFLGALICLAGLLGPERWLRARTRQRTEAIVLGLPDVLDHLTACVEAGLSFDAAVQRIVAQPGQHGRELRGELARYLGDLRLGQSRAEALRDLDRRCGCEDVKGVVAALLQADQLGTGLGSVLRHHSAHLRTRRRQRAQEEAMKAPIKLLFPLVFFVFPAMFLVVLGPAALQMLDTFSEMMGR